jgi:hypothetical protein
MCLLRCLWRLVTIYRSHKWRSGAESLSFLFFPDSYRSSLMACPNPEIILKLWILKTLGQRDATRQHTYRTPQHIKTRTNVHALSWTRTQDPRARAVKNEALDSGNTVKKNLIDDLIVAQLVKKRLSFYGTRMFITVFTRTRHWTSSWAIWFQSTFSHTLILNSILILPFHLCLNLPIGSSLHLFLKIIMYAFPMSRLYIIFTSRPSHLDLILIFKNQYECRQAASALRYWPQITLSSQFTLKTSFLILKRPLPLEHNPQGQSSATAFTSEDCQQDSYA